jgi:hypothetical protein
MAVPVKADSTTDNKWSDQFENKLTAQFQAGLEQNRQLIELLIKQMSAPGIKDGRPLDPKILTTEDEQKRFNGMLDQVFAKVDPETKKPDSSGGYYRVEHIFPMLQTSNPDQYVCTFSLEKFMEIEDEFGNTTRRILGGGIWVRARDFMNQYVPLQKVFAVQ